MKRNTCVFVVMAPVAALLVFASIKLASAQEKAAIAKEGFLLAPRYTHVLNLSTINQGAEDVRTANEKTRDQISRNAGQGPGRKEIPLSDWVDFGGIDQFGMTKQSLCAFSLSVFEDINPLSNIFYYHPVRYSIALNEDSQYMIYFDYKPGQDDKNNVLIKARLTPGYTSGSKELLEQLVLAYLRQQNRPGVQPILLPLPATFKSNFDLKTFGLSKEDITVPEIVPETGDLVIYIQTDVPKKEEFVSNLGSEIGIEGRVALEPVTLSNDELALTSARAVQAKMSFCDREAYSRKRWLRDPGEYTRFKNALAFPVKLKQLIYLRSTNKGVDVRGYDLGDQRLEPGDTAKIPNARITMEIDDAATLAAFYRYSIVCDEKALAEVVASLTGGVASIPVKTADLSVLGPEKIFGDGEGALGVEKIVVAVRSDYFDPTGEKQLTRNYTLTSSKTRQSLESLYLWDEAQGIKQEDRLMYEYLIALIMKDGTRLKDDQWRAVDRDLWWTIDIGASQVAGIIGGGEKDEGPPDAGKGPDDSQKAPERFVDLVLHGSDKVFGAPPGGLGVAKVTVAVRSRYFGRENRESITNNYRLTAAEAKVRIGGLYVPQERGGLDDQLVYEYRIGVVLGDGSRWSDKDWRKPDELDPYSIDLGASQISQIVSQELEGDAE